MNSVFRSSVAALLACVYLIVSLISANSDCFSLKIKSTDKQNTCFTEVSVNFLNAAQRSENAFSSFAFAFSSDFKNASKDSGLIQHAQEKINNAAFRFYRNRPVSALFRFFLTDIIFPFHYFW